MCIRVVGGVVFALAALALVAALRLMEGPVDLDFLKDRIARAADVPGNDIKPEIDRVSLEWGGIRVRIDPSRDPAVLFRCLA